MIDKLGDLITALNRALVIADVSMQHVRVVVNLDGYDFDIAGLEDIHEGGDGGLILRIHLET